MCSVLEVWVIPTISGIPDKKCENAKVQDGTYKVLNQKPSNICIQMLKNMECCRSVTLHLFEIRKPTPTPLPWGLGLCKGENPGGVKTDRHERVSEGFNHVSVIARVSIFLLLIISANEAALYFIDLAFNVANLTLQVIGPGFRLTSPVSSNRMASF